MASVEIIILLASGYYSVKFFLRWYRFLLTGTQIRRSAFARAVLCILPAPAFLIIIFTLITLASFDVVSSTEYILLYLLIGLWWLRIGISLMFFFFDLSWVDDAINMDNPAAALAIFGGGLGVTLIYAGANIGDGPGWWCVFFAGGLGLAAFIVLGVLVNAVAKIFRSITVNHDVCCGIRTCAWFLASGIILGRASAGDWTSFSKTVLEFGDCWPVLILTAGFILFELFFASAGRPEDHDNNAVRYLLTTVLGIVYIAFSVYAVYFLPPLPVNPIYG